MLVGGRFTVRQRNAAELLEVGMKKTKFTPKGIEWSTSGPFHYTKEQWLSTGVPRNPWVP